MTDGQAPPSLISPRAQSTPRSLVTLPTGADQVFRAITKGSGAAVLGLELLVGVFLAYRATEALHTAGLSFFTTTQWAPDAGHGHFGIVAVLFGTILIGLTAVTIALPVSVSVALYLSDYSPVKLRRLFISVVDLMAAVPSIVYGLFGFFFLQGHVIGLARWISTYFGWIPFLHVDGADPHNPLAAATVYTSSTFVAGLVVALMITPVMSSVMREAFAQAPIGEREGAFALGATRWGMVRTVVLPFGKGGIIGGTMLGLGRALGETVAIYLIISLVVGLQPHLLQSGASTVSALIALRFGEASPFATSALMAAGLALFLLTLVVNFAASSIIARSRSGAESGA